MKNQIKKSLSLFMAVLMVLSCWVWVAPTKAEAASSNYQVTVEINMTDNMSKGGTFYVRVWTHTNNATGTINTGSNYIEKAYSDVVSNTGPYTKTIDCGTAWPYYVQVWAVSSGSGSKADEGAFGWTGLKIGDNVDIIKANNFTLNSDTKTTTKVLALHAEGYSPADGKSSDVWALSKGFEKPAIVGFESGTGTKDISLNLNNADSNGNVSDSVKFTPGSFYDQYGVKWVASTYNMHSGLTKSAYISTSATGDPIDANAGADYLKVTDTTIDSNGRDGTVTVQANTELAKVVAKTGGIYSGLHVVYKWETYDSATEKTFTSRTSKSLSVTYPTYTYTFNGAGSITGLAHSLFYKEGDEIKSTDQPLSASGGVGSKITQVPTGEASAEGYTFKGLWTKEQPASGKASFNAKKSEFAEPISSETFEMYKTNGGTVDAVDGNYITYDGATYYNAGLQWASTDTTIEGNRTYRGWWLANAYTVKFYDINGKYLGDREVKHGQTHKDITWPTPTQSYTSGSFQYNNFNGTWVNTDGETVSQSGYTFTKSLILTPKYNVSFTNKYTVKFMSPFTSGATLEGTKEYDYRTTANAPTGLAVPVAISDAIDYSYKFQGWTTTAPSEGDYHVLLEDADFDINGTQIVLNEDWTVRDEATYYAVYRRYAKSYVVNFIYRDATGTEVTRQKVIKYGETLEPPTDVAPEAYVSAGYGYSFDRWQYLDPNGSETSMTYSATIPFNNSNLWVNPEALNDNNAVIPVEFRAFYIKGEAKPYTLTFKYYNASGEQEVIYAEVKNEEFVTEDILNAINPAETWDNENAQYSYKNYWTLTDGAGKLNDADVTKGEVILKSALVNFTPTSNVVFEAVYGDPVNYHTVTYVDGINTYSYKDLTGTSLKDWTYKTTDAETGAETEAFYTPVKADDAKGKYIFQGWYDEKQADAAFNATNGNRYGTQGAAEEAGITTVTADVTLYPQFKFEPFTYTITFLDYNGEVIKSGKFEYGVSLKDITDEAEAIASSRAATETYNYEFIGWDKAVPAKCEGKDLTFIAKYKTSYNYYDATWYNSVLVDGKWVADKSTSENENGETVVTNLIATTHHTYNSKVYAPSAKLVCNVAAPNGQTYVFAGWCYKDAEGNVQKYTRGMLITGEMEFYATYTLTAKTYTVTAVVNGNSETYSAAANENGVATVVLPEPQSGYVDADYHNEFIGWFIDEEGENEFDASAVTADVTVYAVFEVSEHDYTNEKIVTDPTYYAPGKMAKWCSCNAELAKTEEPIAMLVDETIPTGTIYLGGLEKWSSSDTVGAAASDNDEIKYFVTPDTNVIITANDTGKGIRLIKAFAFPANQQLTATTYGVAAQVASTVYEADFDLDEDGNKIYKEDVVSSATYSIKLGEIEIADLGTDGNVQYDTEGNIKTKPLDDGEAYIIYYTVFDKADNQLNTKVRTAKFIYDSSAPTFKIVDADNEEADVFCGSATIVAEDFANVDYTLNGNPIELDANGKYVLTVADNYTVVATDKVGNYTVKTVTVSDHNYITDEVKSTCTADGYIKVYCKLCGDIQTEEVYTKTGHVFGAGEVIEATCTEPGSITYTCQNDCGTVNTFVEDEDGNILYPALGHEYAKDDNGEVIYEVVTESTCTVKGTEAAECLYCDEGRIERELPLDDDNHISTKTVVLQPTCTEAGTEKVVCEACGDVLSEKAIEATGHEETKWVVTTEATCGTAGVETLTCAKCNAPVDSDDEDELVDTREIPATGKHIAYLDTEDERYKEPAAGVEGLNVYKCENDCGWEKLVPVAAYIQYTIKFYAEDGETLIQEVKAEPELPIANVTAPAKANSEDGKFKYTFAGWAVCDANGEPTDKIVTLPMDATADLTLVATYKESKILYTHKFVVPNSYDAETDTFSGTKDFKSLVGAIGDTRKVDAEPVFALADKKADAELKQRFSFKFKGWSYKDSISDDNFVVSINDAIVEDQAPEADKTFVAVFEATALSYQVTYYNGNELVWKTTVSGGQNVTFGGVTPEKAADKNNHYEFDTWYTDSKLTVAYNNEVITGNTQLFAGYTATKHSYDIKGEVTQQATCVDPELTKYLCSCGEYIKEQSAEANGHSWGEYKYDEATGKMVSACANCDETRSYDASYTVTFKNENGAVLASVTVKAQDNVKYDFDKYGTPAQDATAEHTFKFAGWVDEDGNQYVPTKEFQNVTADATYTAYYTKTKRTYEVSYVDADKNIIQSDEVEYGATIPAFTGTNPTKAYDKFNHYVFSGWDTAEGTVVEGKVLIRPVFDAIEHVFDKEEVKEATCTEAGGKHKICSACGYSFASTDVVPMKPHTFVELEDQRVEPNHDTNTPGKAYYECSVCGAKDSKEIPAESMSITITLVDENGNALQGAAVKLYDAIGMQVRETQYTDDKGQTTFVIADGSYNFTVVYDGKEVASKVDAMDGDNRIAVKTTEDCTCSCHRDNFWGILFRLFHKLIRIFTGKIGCCAYPDSRY